jgi:hypothetical protein
MNTVVIGVDPGKDGAITALAISDRVVKYIASIPTPTYVKTLSTRRKVKKLTPEQIAAGKKPKKPGFKTKSIIDFNEMSRFVHEIQSRSTGKIVTYVEEVTAMPGQGVVSMFSFGEAFGLVVGVLSGSGCEVKFTRPQKWKKDIFPKGKLADKEMAIEIAQKLFPNFSFKKTSKCTTYHDGMAESALIAFWGGVQEGIIDQVKFEGVESKIDDDVLSALEDIKIEDIKLVKKRSRKL